MAVVADSGGGGGGYSYPTFEVEISSLGDFLSFVEHELGDNFNAGIDRIKLDAVDSAALAASLAGPMISASRSTYLSAQRFPIENMVRYLFTGVAMLEVIERLMELYKTTEEMAALTAQDVQGFLTAVYEEKYAALQAHPADRPADGGRHTA